MSNEEPVARSTRERIAVKAYELYSQRGCEDGHDMEDWLAAEALLIATPDGPASDGGQGEEGRDDVGRT